MADGLNRVFLVGNLGSDPELRFTQGGQGVLNLRMAVTESYINKDKTRQERTEWINVVIWGKRGEALAKILNKGSQVHIEGSLRTSSYDDREGNKRYKTEVIANNILLLGGRGGAPADDSPDRGGAPRDARPTGGGRQAAPRGQAPARGAPAATPAADDYDGGGYGGGEDDIPY